MQDRQKGYRLFTYTVIASTAIVLFISAAASDLSRLISSQLFLLIVIATVCELVPVEVVKDRDRIGQITLTLPIIIMTAMLYGPLAVIILCISARLAVNVLSWSSASMCRRFQPATADDGIFFPRLWHLAFGVILPWVGRSWLERPPVPFGWAAMNVAFNAADSGLNAGIAAYAYLLVGGQLLSPGSLELSSISWSHTALAGSVALAVFFVGDIGVYTIAGSLIETSSSYNRTWSSFLLRCNILLRQTFPSVLRGDSFLAVLTAILVYLYMHIGTVAILVLFVPLYMVREAISKTFLQVQTYRDTITTLGTYMQRYHPYTRGHLKRVADISERLARELRLPADSVMLMPDAGMLHDIGKVAVSEEILDKIGRLTDEEWAAIKQHPVKGAEIVSHLPYLDKIVDWVKYHHKWIDGSGYPDDGGKDGQIPIEAAIIAVADAFDAMTDDRDISLKWVCDSCGYDPADDSRPEVCPECNTPKRRVYRQPLSLDDAVDQLRRGAGTQFSPKVVKAFLRMLNRDGVRVNA